MGFLEETTTAFGEGDMTGGRVVDSLDFDLATHHGCSSNIHTELANAKVVAVICDRNEMERC